MKIHKSIILFLLASAILSCSVFTSDEDSDADVRFVSADTLFTVERVEDYNSGKMIPGTSCAIASRNDTLILFGRFHIEIATSLDSLEVVPMKWSNGSWGETEYSDVFPSDYPRLVGNPDSLFITGNSYGAEGWRVNMNGFAEYYIGWNGRGEVLWMGDYMGSPHKLLHDGSFDGADSDHVSQDYRAYSAVPIGDSIYVMHSNSAKDKEISDTICSSSIITGGTNCVLPPVPGGFLFNHNGELGFIDRSSLENRNILIRRENTWIKLKISQDTRIALSKDWIGYNQTTHLGKTFLYSDHGIAVVQGDSVIFRGIERLESCFGDASIAIWKDRLILPGYSGTVLAIPLSEINTWN